MLSAIVLAATLSLATSQAQPAPPAGASRPAADCAKVSGQVPQLVCTEADLAALDRSLTDAYGTALKAWPPDVARTQRASQKDWIKGRDACAKAADVRACVEHAYRRRLVEVQITSGQLPPPVPVAFTCAGSGQPTGLLASFYKQTEPQSAVLTYGDEQVIALVAPAASGARYTSADVEFWEHQGEATVTWFGTKFTCRPQQTEGAVTPARVKLAGTSWMLVRFLSMDDTSLTPREGESYVLTFDPPSRLLVQAGCNRGRGTWKSGDEVSLALGPVALTRAACPDTPLQKRFTRYLGYVRSYVVKNGMLHLSLEADGGIYAFAPLPVKAR